MDYQAEIERLSEFLNEEFGDMRGDDESTVDFAIRLLEPQHAFVPDGFGHGECLECGLPRARHVVR